MADTVCCVAARLENKDSDGGPRRCLLLKSLLHSLEQELATLTGIS
ncbi:hypothetical protein Pla144_24660 [Bythopirellula polymerisocia]|uniref:Uncharacterized protein n=1 Tax=Bythopirellula polymerisocia TaxID=2528003 RepID=A0A5C6CYG5_9BACT|nr:hypothetical protein Pla144_24660 [Bythopirellula polymerisocia]